MLRPKVNLLSSFSKLCISNISVFTLLAARIETLPSLTFRPVRNIIAGHNTVHQYTSNPENNLGNGLKRISWLQRKRKWLCPSTRLWLLFFWDIGRIIFVNYLGKGKTINGKYHPALFQRLTEEIKGKYLPIFGNKKMLLHHENALAHTLVTEMSKFHDLHFKLFSHMPYSPDFLKKWLGGQRFSSNNEVTTAADDISRTSM